MINNNTVSQTDNNTPESVVSPQNDGTTTFVASDTAAIRQAPLVLSRGISRSYFPNDVTSVADYLNKPVPVATGSWGTGSTAGTLLYNQDTWVGVWNNTMWKNKLHGFYGLHATLKIDFTLNANPFQAGKLRLCYYPVASLNRAKSAAHISNRIPLSQLPGVDISCADEMITLRVPYISPSRFIELTSSILSWGDLYLAVMSPLVTGSSGPTTADYTIWYSMEDIQLFGQTNRAVSQQSLVGRRKVSQKVNPSDQEFRPISHLLGSAGQFADAVSKVPSLTPWSGPVSWFLSAAKGAAEAFGYSKPINSGPLMMTSNNYHFHTTTAEGLDNSIPLSLNYDAKLKLLSDISEDSQDEMSINFIKKQWSFLEEFTLSTTDTNGMSAYVMGLVPNAMKKTAGTKETYYSPLGYLSTLYLLYRGGFEIKFKFVKTGFHAGSIAVNYVPGPSDTTISNTNASYTYRTIIDLQEGDEACFTVPYMLPLDFIDVGIGFGRLYCNVVNPLRCPETCASAIKVLVYVRGDDSFQVQNPLHVWETDTNQIISPVIPQGGDVNELNEEIVCGVPGGGPSAPLDYEFCQESMSECSTSLLQLLKQYSLISLAHPSAQTSDTSFLFSPWLLSACRYNAATFSYSTSCSTLVASAVLAPFAFFRGGVRIRMTTCTTGSDLNMSYIYRVDTVWAAARYFANGYGSAPNPYILDWDPGVGGPNAPPSWRGPTAPSMPSHGGNAVQVPYQAPYRFSPVIFAHVATVEVPFAYPRPNIGVYTGTNYNRFLSRAFADDFQALFWVGVPRFTN